MMEQFANDWEKAYLFLATGEYNFFSSVPKHVYHFELGVISRDHSCMNQI